MENYHVNRDFSDWINSLKKLLVFILNTKALICVPHCGTNSIGLRRKWGHPKN